VENHLDLFEVIAHSSALNFKPIPFYYQGNSKDMLIFLSGIFELV